MESSLVRVILVTFGGFLLVLLFLSAYDWIRNEYPSRPAEPMNLDRILHPFHHQEAVEALRLFSKLPHLQKTAFQKNLEANIISIEEWITDLKQSNFQILCMGEFHEDTTRSFLSKKFFQNFSVDILLLETTPNELKGLMKRMEAGRSYFPLLGADIMSILRTAVNRNPDIEIFGIEETEKQEENHHGQLNSRDQFIAQNFWSAFKSGSLHIILLGALHCTNEPDWLFHNLCNQTSPALKDKMFNVLVVGEHQNGPVEAFIYFMNQIGIDKDNFAIPDTHSLPNRIYKWFPLLHHQILEKYGGLVIFCT